MGIGLLSRVTQTPPITVGKGSLLAYLGGAIGLGLLVFIQIVNPVLPAPIVLWATRARGARPRE